jgi:hypothetical protein
MTPREFSGHVPAEKHLHYDATGNLTGWTVVERESRIDDADRADLLGLARYELEVCSCGYHPSIADDPENIFQPASKKCPVCGGLDVWHRILHEQDEQATPKDAPPKQPRPSDGRKTYMRRLTPDEAARAAPAAGA